VGDGPWGDPQRCGEADPVGVVAGVTGGVRHQGTNGEVAAQVTPGRPTAQRQRPAEMGSAPDFSWR
jgi:hypothetical protein